MTVETCRNNEKYITTAGLYNKLHAYRYMMEQCVEMCDKTEALAEKAGFILSILTNKGKILTIVRLARHIANNILFKVHEYQEQLKTLNPRTPIKDHRIKDIIYLGYDCELMKGHYMWDLLKHLKRFQKFTSVDRVCEQLYTSICNNMEVLETIILLEHCETEE